MIRLITLLVALVVVPVVGMADVRLAGLFTDHMVIQRETQAPVWGWADSGEIVTVIASWGASASATADAVGKWALKLQTPEAGGPYTLSFQGNNTIELKDVLSGDVWLCSGQSNMQVGVSSSANPAKDIADAQYPQIRNFSVARNPVLQAVDDCSGDWIVCSPETVRKFSAVAYFTGRDLHKSLNVPIGLIGSYWGGTNVESWTPWEVQADDGFALKRKKTLDVKAEGYTPEKAKASYELQLVKWQKKADAAKAQKKRSPRMPKLKTDPLLSPNYPSNLYNGMIHPLFPFAMKGAIWYQGESNASDIAEAEHYRLQLPRMVRSWRKGFGQDIPFYAVQLPNYKQPQVNPVEVGNVWPVIRESFVMAAQNAPGIFVCTTIDLGEADDIHPRNKQDVGRRMASIILNETYAKGTPTTPFMQSFEVVGEKVLIAFDYTGSGLMAKGGGKLKGFAIAGSDQNFVWADAEIVSRDGEDLVLVSSAQVQQPVAVRYAWADNPVESNLYSKEGFPASPYRTDDWNLAVTSESTAAAILN